MSDTVIRLQAGKINALCISEKRGTVKTPVEGCRIVAGSGIEGDAHAGFGHRQVSCLAEESIAKMRRKLPDIAYGAFAENIVTEGIDWSAVPIGAKVRFGAEVIAQVTQHGKECHTPCAIYDATGDCVMPTEGVFLVARTSGELRLGDAVEVDRELSRVRYAVVTLSDRAFAGKREDRSGPAVCENVERGLRATLVERVVVPDDRQAIAQTLIRFCDEKAVDVVFTTGGTGLAPRDVTPEATGDVIDRVIPGIAEAMRLAGLAHTPHAMLSRAICGQRNYTMIVNLSGSPKAVAEQLEAILPALPHAISVISGLPQDCARKD